MTYRVLERFREEIGFFWLSVLHFFAMLCPYTNFKRKFYRLRGTHIGENTHIAGNVFLEEHYPDLIFIGDNVDIAPFCRIVTHSSHKRATMGRDFPIEKGEVTIEDNVYIGTGAIILPNVTIGHNSVIGAGAIVTEDILPFTTAVGVPARPILRNRAGVLSTPPAHTEI